jgi:hypothetical protein
MSDYLQIADYEDFVLAEKAIIKSHELAKAYSMAPVFQDAGDTAIKELDEWNDAIESAFDDYVRSVEES